MGKKRNHIVIGLTGVNYDVKETLAKSLQSQLARLLRKPMHIINYINDAKNTENGVDMKRVFTWESDYLALDNAVKGQSNIVCQSIIDRVAIANLAKLPMDVYFSRVLAGHVREYDLLVYCPPKVQVWDDSTTYESKLDNAICQVISDNGFHAQVIIGDVRQQCDIVLSALRFRLGKTIV